MRKIHATAWSKFQSGMPMIFGFSAYAACSAARHCHFLVVDGIEFVRNHGVVGQSISVRVRGLEIGDMIAPILVGSPVDLFIDLFGLHGLRGDVVNLRLATRMVLVVTTTALCLGHAGQAMASARTVEFAGGGVSVASDGLSKVADTVRKFREGHTAVGSGARDEALALVKDGIADGRLVVHLPAGARLTAASAQVNAGSGDTFVSIPIRGGGLIAPSALVVQIGDSGTVHASEMQFVPTGPASGEMTMWLDGALDQHVVATNDGVVTAAGTPVLAATSAGEVQPMSWWDDFTQCLTDHGLPSWVAATISAVCGLTGIAVGCAVGVALWYANAILECYGA